MGRSYRKESSTAYALRVAHLNGQHTNPRNYAGLCTGCTAVVLAKIGQATVRSPHLATYSEDHSEAAFNARCDRQSFR